MLDQVVADGFYTIINEFAASAASPFYDGYNITTAVGTVFNIPGAGAFTSTGTYFYKLGTKYQGRITWDGGYTATNGLTVTSTGIADDFIPSSSIKLSPNPSNGITTLEYTLTKSALVTYKVMNSIGSEVVTMASNYLSPGTYNDPINLAGRTPGLYLVSIYIDGNQPKHRNWY